MLYNRKEESSVKLIKFVVGRLKNSIESLAWVGWGLVAFESKSGFSTETMRFLNETRTSDGWKEKYGLQDSLANGKRMKEVLEDSWDLATFDRLTSIWKDSLCPVQMQTKACSLEI